MPSPSLHDDRRRTLLCIKTPRGEALSPTVVEAYDTYVVHDTRVASRKAKLGAFDLYLGLDGHVSGAMVECWQAIREFDRNTPFLLVLHRRPPEALRAVFVDEVDAAVDYSDGPAIIGSAIKRLLAAAEERSLSARREEMLAIREEIAERLARLEWRITLSHESMARAQEHIVRAYALQAFARLGGTRSFFERYWLDAYEEALQQTGDVPAAPPTPERSA